MKRTIEKLKEIEQRLENFEAVTVDQQVEKNNILLLVMEERERLEDSPPRNINRKEKVMDIERLISEGKAIPLVVPLGSLDDLETALSNVGINSEKIAAQIRGAMEEQGSTEELKKQVEQLKELNAKLTARLDSIAKAVLN